MNCRLYLKHTEAYVNEARTLGPRSTTGNSSSFISGGLALTGRSATASTPTTRARGIYHAVPRQGGTCHQNARRTGRRFLDVRVNMNHKRRLIEVRRQNIREMLSEISGSWP